MNIFPEIVTSNSEYGSVIISYEKIRFEITTFRTEGKYKDYRKPSNIQYISSLEEDLKRRDFTINTLCIDKEGQKIDLLNAKSDLDNRIVRMIGNPKLRLKEDVLRILRAIRFATVLNFELEPVLKIYIKKYGPLLKKLSKERQKEELDLIFSSPNKEYGIKLLCELKLAENLDIPNLKKVKITPSAVCIWAQLNVLDKFNFTSSERETIINILNLQDKNLLDKKTLYEYGLYYCTLACELQDIDKTKLNKIYSLMAIQSKLDIVLQPSQICKILDKEPGAFLKNIISDLENQILDEKIENNEQKLIDYIINNYK
ncbi:MAG: hypothetical protein IJ093_02670 [Bacilli bacterium]|nr:hypothetical protein [Bacilli bacterium]